VDHDRETTERGAALDVSDQVVGNLDALVGRPEHEVARVEDVLAVPSTTVSSVYSPVSCSELGWIQGCWRAGTPGTPVPA